MHCFQTLWCPPFPSWIWRNCRTGSDNYGPRVLFETLPCLSNGANSELVSFFLVFPLKKKNKKWSSANVCILKIHFQGELNQQVSEKTVRSQLWRERKALHLDTRHHCLARLLCFIQVACDLGTCRAVGYTHVLRQSGQFMEPQHLECYLKSFQEPNSHKRIHVPENK